MKNEENALKNYKNEYASMSTLERINYLKENSLDIVVTNIVGMPQIAPQQTAKNDNEMER